MYCRTMERLVHFLYTTYIYISHHSPIFRSMLRKQRVAAHGRCIKEETLEKDRVSVACIR